jgi:hypothetical protein
VVAPSHQDMKKRRHTTRSTAITSTDRGTVLAAFWASAARGVAGTAITGTDTVGAAGGTADRMALTVDGTAAMAADMEEGEDTVAEAGMVAAETFPSSDATRGRTSGSARAGGLLDSLGV